jgi:succinate dehydrogenase / fumarate reductase, flavoprotein subunit
MMAAVRQQLDEYAELAGVSSASRLGQYFRLQDILTCQYVYLAAMVDYAAQGGMSRGSALYSSPHGQKPDERLPEIFRFSLDDGSRGALVQETVLAGGVYRFNWRPVRPIPAEDDFFENVWRSFRETGNVF